VTPKTGRWNHNTHYYPLILDAVPHGAMRALDVGCGEGMLARELRQRVPDVVGIDLDQASIDLAEAQNANDRVHYVRGDFLLYPFELASFDLVATVATLHHVDAVAALSRIRDLLKPGGVLCAVGLARSQLPRDIPIEIGGAVAHRFHALRKGYWQHPSPTIWPPPETYPGMRRIARELLPGVRFRHHVLWRYSLTWRKPRQ
jgi:SAM-dependent methyltransferase